MATTKKRSGGSRAASGGSRAASGSRSSGGKRTSSGKRASGGGSRASSSRSGSAKRQTAPAPKPFRREVGALVCLLLAIFAAFGYFHMKALFIDLFCALLKGLLGYGFWLMPPALVLCAYILAFHRAARWPCGCAAPWPCPGPLSDASRLLSQVLPWDAALIKTLWATGEELKSGGALGGLLGQVFVSLFTKLGCTIVCVLCGFFLALDACNRSIVDVAEWLFNRPQYEYEPERPAAAVRCRRSRRPRPCRACLQPLPPGGDGHRHPRGRRPSCRPEPPGRPAPEKKKGFFDRKPRVPSPDQLLAGHLGRGKAQAEPQPDMRSEPGPPSSHLRTWLPWTSPSLSPPRS